MTEIRNSIAVYLMWKTHSFVRQWFIHRKQFSFCFFSLPSFSTFCPYCIFLEAASLRVMIVKKLVYFDEKNTTFNSTQFLLSENSDNWLIKVIHLSMSSIIFIGNSFYLWKVLLWDRKLRRTDFPLIQYNDHTKPFEKDVSENHRKILTSKCITFTVMKPEGQICNTLAQVSILLLCTSWILKKYLKE